jgi:thiol:disulfide interchange protein DsbD
MGGRDVLHPLAPLARAPGGQAQAVGAAPDPAAVAAAVKGRFVQIDSVQALDNLLAQTSRPVMLDFYADWCVSCIEMERFTFSDPQVAQLLSQFVLVQADVTKNLPEHRALLKRFKLFGPPGIMFFDGSGRQLEDIRVVGFRKARDFEAVLRDVLGQKTAPASAS